MDSGLLSIIGSITQVYASLLGIIGMYLIFLMQRREERVRELRVRLETKVERIIDFINREIAPAYPSKTLLRIDTGNYENVARSIETYRSERQNEIPRLDMEGVKSLIVLWAIVDNEKDEFRGLKNEFDQTSQKLDGQKWSVLIFVGYFVFELVLSLSSLLLIMGEYVFQNSLTQLVIVLAIIGVLPLVNLFYKLR